RVNDSDGTPFSVWTKYLNTDVTTGKGRMAICASAGTDDAIVAYTAGSVLDAVRVTAATGAPGVDGVPPAITQDVPATVHACDGDTVMLSIQVTGTPAI